MKSRIVASLVLILLLVSSVAWLLSLDWEARLSTDVMELIPTRSPSPELALGRSVLSDIYANRVMVAMREVGDPSAVDAYIACLEASPLVDVVINLSDADAFTDVGQFVFEHRFELLFPFWYAQLGGADIDASALAQQVATRMDSALNDPAFVAFEDLVPSDPLLLMRDAAETFQFVQPASDIDPSTCILEVSLTVSSLKAEGQGPVITLLTEAEAVARMHSPSIRVLDTGVHRYAGETETAMRREVKLLNVSTFIVVFLICVCLCRRVFLVFHVFLILLLSLVSGLALMLVFVHQVHVFALIFGSVLCGVIVDYGLHAYLHESGHLRRSLRTFLKPFLISCGSTLMGFSILLFSDLPVLRQMGLLVVCGLFMAVVVTLIYVFGILRVGPRAPAFARVSSMPRWGIWAVACVGLVALAVLPSVHWQDDIRHLKYPLPHLDLVDAEIRNLRGVERLVLLTVGDDYADSRANLEQLNQWLSAQGMTHEQMLNASGWVAPPEAFERASDFARQHPEFGEQVLNALATAGYEREAFLPFMDAWQAYQASLQQGIDFETLVHEFSSVLSGGLSGIIGANDTLHWWVTLVDLSMPLPTLPVATQTLSLSQVESMSSVLSDYRERTAELSLFGGALMYAVLLFAFGVKDGTRLFAIPFVAVAAATVILFYTFGALGIFHLVGLFLGACLVLDYAVFSWIGMQREGEIPFSVIVSALTTIASFFILGWSQIPAIHALGFAVAVVTLVGSLSSLIAIPSVASRQGGVDA